MAMTLVKQTENHRIYKRGDGRYAVKDAHRQPVNGDEKVAVLLQEGLVEAPKVKAPEPEPEAVEPETAEAEAQDAEAAGDEEAPAPDAGA